ncbi:MAG TPA: hypothetical protein VM166_03905 [Gemmatimonadaceae bacterium]|nr:hypothetical protein [Gemmatimonadaceae bacterium]
MHDSAASEAPTNRGQYRWFIISGLVGGAVVVGVSFPRWLPLLLPSYVVAVLVNAAVMITDVLRLRMYSRVPMAVMAAFVSAVYDAVKVYGIAIIIGAIVR